MASFRPHHPGPLQHLTPRSNLLCGTAYEPRALLSAHSSPLTNVGLFSNLPCMLALPGPFCDPLSPLYTPVLMALTNTIYSPRLSSFQVSLDIASSQIQRLPNQTSCPLTSSSYFPSQLKATPFTELPSLEMLLLLLSTSYHKRSSFLLLITKALHPMGDIDKVPNTY